MMTIGFYIAKCFASGLPQQKCISLECGLQNGTLAAFVGTQLFDKIVFIPAHKPPNKKENGYSPVNDRKKIIWSRKKFIRFNRII